MFSGNGCAAPTAYANVSPWSRKSRPRDVVGTLGEGTRVKWRYESRDGRFTMVRLPGWKPRVSPVETSWFFVRSGCIVGAKHVGCFKHMRCRGGVGRRDATVAWRGRNSQGGDTLAQRTPQGDRVAATGDAFETCDGGPQQFQFGAVAPLAPDGTFSSTTLAGDSTWTLSGKIGPGVVTGTFRQFRPACDTGVVTFSLPLQPPGQGLGPIQH